MDPRTVARAVAAGRVGLGLALLLAPRFVMHRLGETLDPPRPYAWWLRAFGIRDVVLGSGALLALDGSDDAAALTWVQAGAVADTADAATALLARRDLGRRQRALILTVAAGAAGAGWWAASATGRD